LAKSVFQVHGVDATGQVMVRKSLRRSQMLPFFAKLPPCLVGIEACGTSYHWARELIKLGHEVRLMPPAYVNPYVKRGKTDAADAEAVCEAVTRPTMRFVAVKTLEQQAALSMRRTRDLLVKQRTQLINMIDVAHGLVLLFGIGTKGPCMGFSLSRSSPGRRSFPSSVSCFDLKARFFVPTYASLTSTRAEKDRQIEPIPIAIPRRAT
jgi:hypothetical protein